MVPAKLYRVSRLLLLAGPLAFAVFSAGVLLSSQLNPWWSLYKDAFSDLGGPKARAPWIFNSALIVAGVLFCMFSIGLLGLSKSRVVSFASGLLFMAGVFLALIGVYPSGTRPHVFVSSWFYVQSFMGMAVLGVGLLLEKKLVHGIALLLLGVLPMPLALLVEATIGWPSIAILELAGAFFILAGALLLLSNTL
ncbi:DUF998 domain-containing protein [Infirmifilum lucidum]|uniref:DUF998 domain-containing protein n=1 Tax=Infirmifilum lucidum TaxID=2776706 RepID=A0A7L9FK19_9CREN|nr:DUF998 domain-containing protein [Infirmifilum lucidum]QOJ79353.1 DUF998 domain-containing protein [Infirmifilum lucidum]